MNDDAFGVKAQQHEHAAVKWEMKDISEKTKKRVETALTEVALSTQQAVVLLTLALKLGGRTLPNETDEIIYVSMCPGCMRSAVEMLRTGAQAMEDVLNMYEESKKTGG